MSYRNTGPEVYDYRGTYHSSIESYDPRKGPHDPAYTIQHQSHIAPNPVYVEQSRPNPVVNPPAAVLATETKGSQVNRKGSKYAEYRTRPKEYKYNFFSMMDEPWNRCCEVGKCGSCPGNECVAKREPINDWL